MVYLLIALKMFLKYIYKVFKWRATQKLSAEKRGNMLHCFSQLLFVSPSPSLRSTVYEEGSSVIPKSSRGFAVSTLFALEPVGVAFGASFAW